MRSQKGSHRIVVCGVEYRWRATGNDGHISIGIWPSNNVGPYIQGNLGYHETWIDNGDGSWSSMGNQIVITSRIIRRIIEHAIAAHGFDPLSLCRNRVGRDSAYDAAVWGRRVKSRAEMLAPRTSGQPDDAGRRAGHRRGAEYAVADNGGRLIRHR